MHIEVTQKQTGYSFTSVMFLALAIMSVLYSVTVRTTPMLWFGLTASAFSLAGFMHSLWKKELILQIDDSGIYDKRLGMGKILWSDLKEVQLQVTPTNKFLCFSVQNPEPYLARLQGAEHEKMIFHRSLGFYGFNIDVSPMDVNLLELKKQIDQRLNQQTPSDLSRRD